MSEKEKLLEELLDRLCGPRDEFRRQILDTDALLRCFMSYAERKGKRPAWSIVGEITGHGSGVATAIYEYYRDRSKLEKP